MLSFYDNYKGGFLMKLKRLLFSILFLSLACQGVYANTVSDSTDLKMKIANQEYSQFADALIEKLGQDSDTFVLNDINEFLMVETNRVKGDTYKLLNENSKLNKGLKKSYLAKDQNTVVRIYRTRDFAIEFFDNGIFSVETGLNQSPQISLLATGTVYGSATKAYYSAAGVNVFTISVSSTFSFNGTRASYYSGFDAYYTRGFLSIWQVSNWASGKEAVGSSYSAFAKGNFHFGLEVDGIGIVIQDFYIKHTVTCSKDGAITRNYVQN